MESNSHGTLFSTSFQLGVQQLDFQLFWVHFLHKVIDSFDANETKNNFVKINVKKEMKACEDNKNSNKVNWLMFKH
jgi:hypothetical protein